MKTQLIKICRCSTSGSKREVVLINSSLREREKKKTSYKQPNFISLETRERKKN